MLLCVCVCVACRGIQRHRTAAMAHAVHEVAFILRRTMLLLLLLLLVLIIMMLIIIIMMLLLLLLLVYTHVCACHTITNTTISSISSCCKVILADLVHVASMCIHASSSSSTQGTTSNSSNSSIRSSASAWQLQCPRAVYGVVLKRATIHRTISKTQRAATMTHAAQHLASVCHANSREIQVNGAIDGAIGRAVERRCVLAAMISSGCSGRGSTQHISAKHRAINVRHGACIRGV